MDTKGNEVINALANYFHTDYDTVETALGRLIDGPIFQGEDF